MASFRCPCYNERIMMQTLEGTWEDVARHAPELMGRRVRLTILEEDQPQPNKKALAVIRRIAERQKNMRSTTGESGIDIVRRGRAGEMFGYDATE